jgi:hypothetical protein
MTRMTTTKKRRKRRTTMPARLVKAAMPAVFGVCADATWALPLNLSLQTIAIIMLPIYHFYYCVFPTQRHTQDDGSGNDMEQEDEVGDDDGAEEGERDASAFSQILAAADGILKVIITC